MSGNDFTIEELGILKRAMDYWVGENAGKVIKNKIQSMIDNYCEHETNVMSDDERKKKFKIYQEKILPQYDNDPDKVPPHLEPDFNEGWRC